MKEDQILADFSKSRVPENLGVTLIQVMKLTAVCLQKTLGKQHKKSIEIKWLAPEDVSLADAGLPSVIEKTEEEAVTDQSVNRRDSDSESDDKPQPEGGSR